MKYYICKSCGSKNESMVLTKDVHVVTEPERLRIRGNPVLEQIGHEILVCSCGRRNSWFDLEERNDE